MWLLHTHSYFVKPHKEQKLGLTPIYIIIAGVSLSYGLTYVNLCVSSSDTVKEKGRGKDETYWREINAAMALTNLAKPKDGAPAGTTSCIIQKSSHIAEIKTVKVPIMHKY